MDYGPDELGKVALASLLRAEVNSTRGGSDNGGLITVREQERGEIFSVV